MKNLQDYLIPTSAESYDEMRIAAKINLDSANPFYLPFKGDDRKHYNLSLNLQGRWVGEGEDEEWFDACPDMLFRMTTYGVPTMEQFSEHIRTEINATIDAMGVEELKPYNDTQFFFEQSEIEPKHVYKFLKNIHMDYTKTEKFLEDYDHYANRMYHNMKWINSLAMGKDYMFSQTYNGDIGMERVVEFLK